MHRLFGRGARAGMVRVLSLLIVLTAACGPTAVPGSDPLPGYRAATPAERAAILAEVDAYYAARAAAIAAHDPQVLFRAYPKLSLAEDRAHGINDDGFFIERMRNIGVRTVVVRVEAGEPLRVFVKDAAAVAYVSGSEEWIESGTKTQVLTRIDLERDASGWSVVRTDIVKDGERRSPTPR